MNVRDLEQACEAVRRGPEGTPDFLWHLREAQLWFLVPSHPELGHRMELRAGDGVPVVLWEKGDELIVPVFTQEARAWEAMAAAGMNAQSVVAGQMKGEFLWMILSGIKDPKPDGVVINPMGDPGDMFLPMATVEKLADGSILKPVPPRAGVMGRVRLVRPQDYPREFLLPVCRFLQGRNEVRAAWFFRELELPNPATISHIFGLWLNCEGAEAQRLEDDLTVMAKQVCPQGAQFGVMMLSETNPDMARVMREHPPFYKALDYRPPREVAR